MIPLYNDKQFKSSKSRDKLPLKCKYCGKTFLACKNRINVALNPNDKNKLDFCSIQCGVIYNNNLKNRLSRLVQCKQCGKTFKRAASEIKKVKNTFCSKSCAATYNNTHKTKGTKVSKLETYLQSQLAKIFPNLNFEFNKKDAIGSELDIYIPSVNLAFEINGIFHYKPIFGVRKFKQIKNNDSLKLKACRERNIELHIIDASGLKYFEKQSAEKYLNLINDIIKKNLGLVGLEPTTCRL